MPGWLLMAKFFLALGIYHKKGIFPRTRSEADWLGEERKPLEIDSGGFLVSLLLAVALRGRLLGGCLFVVQEGEPGAQR